MSRAALAPVPAAQSEPIRGAGQLFSIAALADRWGVSPSLVRKWLRNGQLACFRLGTRVAISQADADQFLASRRHEASR